MECMSEPLILECIDFDFNTRFLLARLHLDSLAQEPTVGDIELALQNLPAGLDETYKQTLRRIESQGTCCRRLAKKILSWAVYAKRILSIYELQHAVAVQFGKPDLDKKFIPSVGIIGSVCAGLITIDTQSDVVRLVHYTTQEYLERTEKDWFPKAETYITMTCITYLSFKDCESGFCQTDEEFEKRLQLNPLYNYAAQNWGNHARTASLEVEQSILDFLWSEAKVSASAQALIAFRYYAGDSGYSQHVPRQIIGVHIAAYFGLTGVVMALLKNRDHLNIKDGWDRTPLAWAVENGHEVVVKLLLEEGAELESTDKSGQTPLSWAVEEGHAAVVKLLLEKGAELESKDKDGQTALLKAAMNRHEVVVELLIEKGAELESKNNFYGRTPLSWAVEQGHEAVVRLLLEKGAELESTDRWGQTPLSLAAEQGHEGAVKLLLEKGAELESKDKYSQTPLSWAAEKGQEAVVKLLLEKGAELKFKDWQGQTPLSKAAIHGRERMVELLLERGAELESKDDEGQTALSLAAQVGNEAVIKLLIGKGAQLESKDDEGQTALSFAAQVGNEAVIKLLIGKGAQLESKDESTKTPLDWAKEKGHAKVVKLLASNT